MILLLAIDTNFSAQAAVRSHRRSGLAKSVLSLLSYLTTADSEILHSCLRCNTKQVAFIVAGFSLVRTPSSRNFSDRPCAEICPHLQAKLYMPPDSLYNHSPGVPGTLDANWMTRVVGDGSVVPWLSEPADFDPLAISIVPPRVNSIGLTRKESSSALTLWEAVLHYRLFYF